MAIYSEDVDPNTTQRTQKGDTTWVIEVKIRVEVSSPEYDSIDSIIDEFQSECDYSLPDTPNVRVHHTEWVDTESVAGSINKN